jgi:hypothetical protein
MAAGLFCSRSVVFGLAFLLLQGASSAFPHRLVVADLRTCLRVTRCGQENGCIYFGGVPSFVLKIPPWPQSLAFVVWLDY